MLEPYLVTSSCSDVEFQFPPLGKVAAECAAECGEEAHEGERDSLAERMSEGGYCVFSYPLDVSIFFDP
jgi:hypothetical protein